MRRAEVAAEARINALAASTNRFGHGFSSIDFVSMLSVFSLSAALGVAFSAPSDALRQQSSAQPYCCSCAVSLKVLSARGEVTLS
jgi:hypothetical protein